MSYIDIIKTACLFFPVLSFIITIPFILKQYHKYGSIPILRIVIAYSFTLYLLIAYFLIILPLPTITEVKNMTGPIANLIPFSFIYDFAKATSIFSSQVYTVVFNLFLTVPFGIYLRYYFKQDFKRTVLYTFLLSLFFEVTQLTGLYFIYPRAYRLFDLDDLLINTLGGALGFYLTRLFTFFLPTRDELDNISYKRGTKVSLLRRTIAYIIDINFIVILCSIVHYTLNIFNVDFFGITSFVITIILYYPVYMNMKKGQTIGKRIVKIKIVKENDDDAKWHNYFMRYLVLYSFITVIPYLLFFLILKSYKILEPIAFVILLCILMFIIIIIGFYILVNNIMKKKLFLYERITKTKNVSTITYKEEEIINKNK